MDHIIYIYVYIYNLFKLHFVAKMHSKTSKIGSIKNRLSFNAGNPPGGAPNRGAAGGYGLDVAARQAAVVASA